MTGALLAQVGTPEAPTPRAVGRYLKEFLRSETWIVGDRGEALTSRDDGELRHMLAMDRRRLTGRDDDPLSIYMTRWPAAIPVCDHAILSVQNELSSLPTWLALSGNYLGKIGVAALLDIAAGAANRVAS